MRKGQSIFGRVSGKPAKKLRSRAGFSLGETLVALLILLMVSSIVAAGIPSAVRAYRSAVDASNAQILLSTAVTTLRDQLGSARSAQVGEEGKDITYFCADIQAPARLYLDADKSYMMLQEYVEYEAYVQENPGKARCVAELQSAGGRLFVTCEKITFENGLVTVTDLKVLREEDSTVLASLPNLLIRVFSES